MREKKRDSCSKAFRYFLLHQLMEKENFFPMKTCYLPILSGIVENRIMYRRLGKKKLYLSNLQFWGISGPLVCHAISAWNARNVLGIHLWPAVEEQGSARKWKRKVLWKKYSIPDGSKRVLFHSVGSLHCSKILPRWIFRQL